MNKNDSQFANPITQADLVAVAHRKGAPKKMTDWFDALWWLNDHGHLIAFLPDGHVVTRKTDNLYHYVVVALSGTGYENANPRWGWCQWTSQDPAKVVRQWNKKCRFGKHEGENVYLKVTYVKTWASRIIPKRETTQ